MLSQLIWRCSALCFVVLAVIGIILPGMPTTVFLLLATWAAGHGWPALNRWILQHPRLGPPIHNWQRNRTVPRRAKYLASTSMAVSILLIFLSGLPLWAKWVLPSVIVFVLIWLLSRPELSPTHSTATRSECDY
jgi:uncharacterized membrane protein YbaN (DUF454 family)